MFVTGKEEIFKSAIREKRKFQDDFLKNALSKMERGTAQPQDIHTSSTGGTFYLSTDKELNNGPEPIMIKIDDIQTLKRLTGNPDVFCEAGMDHPPFTEPMHLKPDMKNLDWNSLDGELRGDLCRTFVSYVYGDSKSASAYENVLNDAYFPMEIPVFEAANIDIKKGETLVVKNPDPDKPAVVIADKITIHGNGKLQVESTASIKATTLEHVMSTGDLLDKTLFSKGGDGGNGGASSSGLDGGDGGNGADSTWETNKKGDSRCTKDGENGQNGVDGTNGTKGGNGGDGGHASKVDYSVATMIGTFLVGSIGGKGGNGANGGNGGDGGKGGKGGSGRDNGHGGDGGNGGNGGCGGDGGHGGNGGNGAVCQVTYSELQGEIKISNEKALGGNGGNGGNGGMGGASGVAGDNGGGKAGTRGTNGNGGNGSNGGNGGMPGSVYIMQA